MHIFWASFEGTAFHLTLFTALRELKLPGGGLTIQKASSIWIMLNFQLYLMTGAHQCLHVTSPCFFSLIRKTGEASIECIVCKHFPRHLSLKPAKTGVTLINITNRFLSLVCSLLKQRACRSRGCGECRTLSRRSKIWLKVEKLAKRQ